VPAARTHLIELPRLASVIGAMQTRMPRAAVTVDDGKPCPGQLRVRFDDAAIVVLPVIVPPLGLDALGLP